MYAEHIFLELFSSIYADDINDYWSQIYNTISLDEMLEYNIPQNLNPKRKRKRFDYSTQDDDTLLKLVEEIGCKWRTIRIKLNTRATDDAIRNRWKRLKGISANKQTLKNCHNKWRPWTHDEDKLILSLYKNGYRTDKNILHKFENRTTHAIRNRLNRLNEMNK